MVNLPPPPCVSIGRFFLWFVISIQRLRLSSLLLHNPTLALSFYPWLFSSIGLISWANSSQFLLFKAYVLFTTCDLLNILCALFGIILWLINYFTLVYLNLLHYYFSSLVHQKSFLFSKRNLSNQFNVLYSRSASVITKTSPFFNK